MSQHREPKERRKSRRVGTTLDVTLAGLGFGAGPVEARAQNLSAGGVYASAPRYFAPLSKVELMLVLPPFGQEAEGGARAPAREDPAAAGTAIRAEGIIVRCDPVDETEERFTLGIAFLNLPPADRDRIEGYVNWRIERSLIESAGS